MNTRQHRAGHKATAWWEKVIGKKPADNIFGSFQLFNSLGEGGFKESAAGGRLIEMPLEYAENSTFKSYSELEVLDTTRIDVFDAARYDWKINSGTIVFSDFEKLRAAGEGKIELVADKIENGKNSHLAVMNRQGYSDGSGNGGKDIEGLLKLISETPTTGTVGGINRATFTFWRNQAVSGAKTTSAFDNLRAAMDECYDRCSRGGTMDVPTAAITSRAVFEGYKRGLTSNERYVMDAKPKKADGAFDNEALAFRALPLRYDEDITPVDDVYFLNNKALKFVYLQGAWMKAKPEIEPANQLAAIVRIFTFGNFAVNNSRRLGVVYDIT